MYTETELLLIDFRSCESVEGGEVLNLADESSSKIEKKKATAPIVEIPLPQTYDEAWDIVHRFEQGAPIDERISDSVAHHALKGTGSLRDEPWSGSEDDERLAYVTEGEIKLYFAYLSLSTDSLSFIELYIHTKVRISGFVKRRISTNPSNDLKLLIVDDKRVCDLFHSFSSKFLLIPHLQVLMGSANLNDRSQNGDHDSEIALVVEDTEQLESRMDGQKFMASRFAATLRRQLWREHLG